MAKMNVGLQMYTLREETAIDFVGTLHKVAKIGYEGVEFAGYGGLTAVELKELLEQLKIKAIASHVSLAQLTTHLDEEIDYNLTIGSRYIVCPYVADDDRQTEAQWLAIIQQLQVIGQRCAERGIGFAYHNHDFELLQQVNGVFVLDAMMKEVPEAALLMELDSCWVHHAGQNPQAYIAQYSGRIPLLHLKDMQKLPSGETLTVELGRGEVDLIAIIEASAKAGVEWLIVEQDKCTNPPFESIEESYNWVVKNYK
ncbi:sugar phosphate isomerase/epimerase [Paenibacillus psychroresistens]|uniref:Sugar phosphate isomerase/epimerase n=1 Tax=Paenibacillus psychroresistens TaxID=1778678 RepID=A0A6B8RXK9_9BACL|nr:sugar phosphate isomerase/epimerase [Paenibacillus psychroresistens]